MALTSSCSCWVQPALRSAHWPRPHTAEPRLLLPCLRSGVAAHTCSSCNNTECWDGCAHACMEAWSRVCVCVCVCPGSALLVAHAGQGQPGEAQEGEEEEGQPP
jgi:hypothetical protein